MINYPFISIITINWNSTADLKKLLLSIKNAHYPKNKYEIIVVDNASDDFSSINIQRKFPDVQIIRLSQNIGTPARNIAIKKAKGKYIFSIDSDVIVSKDLFTKVVEKMESDQTIGIVGVKVLQKIDKKPWESGTTLNFYTGIIKQTCINSENNNYLFLAGLFYAYPKQLIEKIGLYNKEFFFYGEDLDLSLRVRRAGFKILYFPHAYVYHGKSKSTKDIPHSIKYHHYYKALFWNIYEYGNIFQKVSTTIFQLILIPFYRLFMKKENTFPSRWWGFWWNIRHIDRQTKLFTVLFIFALLLRIAALDKRDFWFDEAFTYHIARLETKDLILAVLTDNNPPFYYLLIHLVLKVSTNQILLRIPSFIFNTISIFFIYATFKTHINKTAGLIAASLFSVSPLAIYIATEARLHSLALLFVIMLVFLFFSLIKNPQRKTLIGFTITTILGFYTQYYIILLFVPFTMIVLRKNNNLKLLTWFIIMIIVSATIMPWLFLSSRVTHNGCSCPNTLLSLPASLVSPALAGVGEVTLRSFPLLPFPLFVFFSLTAFIILLLFIKGLLQTKSFSLLYLVPLIMLSISGFIVPVFSAKAFSIFSPLFFGIVAKSIVSFRNQRIIIIFLILTFTSISIIQITNPFFSGTRLKQIYALVQQDPSSPIMHSSVLTFYSINYYSQTYQTNALLTSNPLSITTVNFIGGKMQKINPAVKTLWFVDTKTWANTSDYRSITSLLRTRFTILKAYSVGTTITVYYLQQK